MQVLEEIRQEYIKAANSPEALRARRAYSIASMLTEARLDPTIRLYDGWKQTTVSHDSCLHDSFNVRYDQPHIVSHILRTIAENLTEEAALIINSARKLWAKGYRAELDGKKLRVHVTPKLAGLLVPLLYAQGIPPERIRPESKKSIAIITKYHEHTRNFIGIAERWARSGRDPGQPYRDLLRAEFGGSSKQK